MASRAQGVIVDCGDVTSLPDYDLRYRGLRMQVTVYDGSPLIHIREKVSWNVSADPQAPSTSAGRRRTSYTRKGVTLTADEWEQLLDMGDEVERKCRGKEPYRADLGDRGRQCVVAFYNEEWRINIRNYWDPKGDGNLLPTRIGVALSLKAFRRLRTLSEFVQDDLERLSEYLTAEQERLEWEDRYLEARREEIRARRAAVE